MTTPTLLLPRNEWVEFRFCDLEPTEGFYHWDLKEDPRKWTVCSEPCDACLAGIRNYKRFEWTVSTIEGNRILSLTVTAAQKILDQSPIVLGANYRICKVLPEGAYPMYTEWEFEEIL